MKSILCALICVICVTAYTTDKRQKEVQRSAYQPSTVPDKYPIHRGHGSPFSSFSSTPYPPYPFTAPDKYPTHKGYKSLTPPLSTPFPPYPLNTGSSKRPWQRQSVPSSPWQADKMADVFSRSRKPLVDRAHKFFGSTPQSFQDDQSDEEGIDILQTAHAEVLPRHYHYHRIGDEFQRNGYKRGYQQASHNVMKGPRKHLEGQHGPWKRIWSQRPLQNKFSTPAPANQPEISSSNVQMSSETSPDSLEDFFDDISPKKGRFDLDSWGSLEWSVENLFEETNKGDWWRGPNVCERREEKELATDEDKHAQSPTISTESLFDLDISMSFSPIIRHHHMTSVLQCDETNTSYKCTTTVEAMGKKKIKTVVYECCNGYQRSAQGNPGCSAVRNLTNILQTAEDLGATEFVNSLRSWGIDDDLSMGNFTVFVPENEAFKRIHNNSIEWNELQDLEKGDIIERDDIPPVIIVSPVVAERVDKLKLEVAGHIVEGFARTSDFSNDLLIQTPVPDANIRINIYEMPKRVITANCVPINSSDNYATNGIVHTVSEVLPLAVDSILTIIKSRKDLSTLSALLQNSTIAELLEKSSGHVTLLAPNNEAFTNLNLSSYTTTCMDKILRHHLLPNVICMAAIPSRAKTMNSLQNFIAIERTKLAKQHLTIDGVAEIVDPDCMAANGVVHVVDRILLPAEATDTLQLVRQNGGSKFANYIEAQNFDDTLLSNVTMFVPVDSAVIQFERNRPEGINLHSILRYHMVQGEITADQLRIIDHLPTMEKNLPLRINKYSTHPFGPQEIVTAQCARIVKSNMYGCSGVVHFIDRVLQPSNQSVMSRIQTDSQFRKFASILRQTGLMDELQNIEFPVTILAPTDQAFAALGREIDTILTASQLRGFLRHHVIPRAVCCESASQPGFFLSKSREHTMGGGVVSFSRDLRGNSNIDTVQIKACDIMAANGIIHQIDELLPSVVQTYCLRCRSLQRQHHMVHQSDMESLYNIFRTPMKRKYGSPIWFG